MAVGAAIASVFVAAGAAEAQRREGVRTRRGAKRVSKEQTRRTAEIASNRRQRERSAQQTAFARAERARQRGRAAAVTGRRGDIVAGAGVGNVAGEAQAAAKTLIGGAR